MATRYVILQETALENETFKPVGTIDANNPDQARTKYADTLTDEELDAGVRLAAVPARNWKVEPFGVKRSRRVVKG